MNIEKELDLDFYELLPTGALSGRPGQVIKRRRILIGRSQTCDIVLNHREVTAIHAVLEVTKGGARVFDMNSTNGTFVNGKKIVTDDVSLGDTISFGGYEFILKKYVKSEVIPPPLDMLSGVNAGLPPTIKADAPPVTATTVSSPELPKTLPKKSSTEEFVPRVEYPLAKDPKAEFSEYIFEDVETLYPIFNYNISHSAVEVIILFRDVIYSVDYVPAKNGVYNLVGRNPSGGDIEYAYLGKNDKTAFIEVRGGDIIVSPLHGYKTMLISDGVKELGTNPHVLLGDEIIRFTTGELQIFVRNSAPPPIVKPAPIFRRDSEFKRLLLLMFLFMIVFTGGIAVVHVDKEVEKEKVPERIATILYKKELHASKSPAIAKTENAPKNVVQKAPSQKVPEKAPEKVETKVADTKQEARPKQDNVGTPDSKQVGVVKKAEPNKGPTNTKTTMVRPTNPALPKAKAGGGGGKAATVQAKAPTPSVSKGAVETYKSNDWASTLSSAMAKGGSASGKNITAATGGGSGSGVGAATGAGTGYGGVAIAGGSDSATLETAKVTTNVGSLAGASTGTLDSAKGVDGLVNKKGIYTAGLPYKTVILGGMDPDIIRRILIENIPFFRQCYQKVLDREQQAYHGVVRLDFIIGASGRVTKAGVESASGSLPGEVKGCVADVLRGIQFPEPKGGGVVEVNQPFNFYPRRN